MALKDPTEKSPERAFALQKYLLLHSQHDALQKHLHETSPTSPHSHHRTFSATATNSPTRSRNDSVTSAISTSSDDDLLPQSRNHRRRFSLPPKMHSTIEGDEAKLQDVNQQIKTTLTELLNCDSVKNDAQYRNWVQTRLMEAEKEMKGIKSRRLSEAGDN